MVNSSYSYSNFARIVSVSVVFAVFSGVIPSLLPHTWAGETALSTEQSPFVKTFTSDSPDQMFIVGDDFYRLQFDTQWNPQVFSIYRGAEFYGGPKWSLKYFLPNDPVPHTLEFRKNGKSTLKVHPAFAVQSLADQNIAIEHELTPKGWALTDRSTIHNLTDKPIQIHHYQIWDLYYHPVIPPNLFELLRPTPGEQMACAYKARKDLRDPEPRVLTEPGENGDRLLGFQTNRSYLLRPPRRDLLEKNFYPANVKVTFSEVDEIFNLIASWKDPGSKSYMEKESLAALLDPDQLYGPVMTGLRTTQIGPHQVLTLESTFLLELGENSGFDPNQSVSSTPIPHPELSSLDLTQNIQRFLSESQWTRLRNEIEFKILQMKSLSTWDEISREFITTQGAYYISAIGKHTAFRDFMNAVVGLSKTIPSLAKSNLNYSMSLQSAKNSFFPYAWSGVMKVNLGYGQRTDLAPCLIWGVNSYMNANADWNWFLNSSVPFYPPTSKDTPPGARGQTPFDHVKAAFYYLRDEVKLGPNKLPRIGSGDWSDAVLTLAGPLGSPAYTLSLLKGESPMVGQMALVVLNDFRKLLKSAPPALNKDRETLQLLEDIDQYIKTVRTALRRVYDENAEKGFPFFPRAMLYGNLGQSRWANSESVDAAAQVWALMATDPTIEVLNSQERNQLIDLILAKNQTFLGIKTTNAPQETSERDTADYFKLQSRPWSVITQWFTHALIDNGRIGDAWTHLWKTSLANHNDLFAPRDSQNNIINELISGFDAWNLNGSAWFLAPELPMDFNRWNNSNHTAMFLWAAFDLIEATRKLGAPRPY